MKHDSKNHRPLDETGMCHSCFEPFTVAEVLSLGHAMPFFHDDPTRLNERETPACPHCQVELPRTVISSKFRAVRLCLVGPPGSGKSHIMWWLGSKLASGLSTLDGVRVTGRLWDPTGEWLYYFPSADPRSAQTELLPTISTLNTAWLFEITVSKHGLRTANVLLHVLDVAGEEWHEWPQFVDYADCLVLVTNPQAIFDPEGHNVPPLEADSLEMFMSQLERWYKDFYERTIVLLLSQADDHDPTSEPRKIHDQHVEPGENARGSLTLREVGEDIQAASRTLDRWLRSDDVLSDLYFDLLNKLVDNEATDCLVVGAVGGLFDKSKSSTEAADEVVQSGRTWAEPPDDVLMPVLATFGRLGILDAE